MWISKPSGEIWIERENQQIENQTNFTEILDSYNLLNEKANTIWRKKRKAEKLYEKLSYLIEISNVILTKNKDLFDSLFERIRQMTWFDITEPWQAEEKLKSYIADLQIQKSQNDLELKIKNNELQLSAKESQTNLDMYKEYIIKNMVWLIDYLSLFYDNSVEPKKDDILIVHLEKLLNFFHIDRKTIVDALASKNSEISSGAMVAWVKKLCKIVESTKLEDL